MALKGTVSHCNIERRFLFVVGKNERGQHEKFYSNYSYITLSEPELVGIRPGCVVEFAISPVPPKKENGLRVACDLRISAPDPSDILAGKKESAGGAR